MRDIARKGLKGRKKDTLLLKLVITLAFIFIVTSTIFQSSIDKTKLEQRLNLYSKWHAAYLKANKETLERLKSETDVHKVGESLIIGESEKSGVVGTFNQDLLDMGNFTLYKGRVPEAHNEIMLELNMMSNMNLDLEVGQKIDIAIPIQRASQGYKDYILNLNKVFHERIGDFERPDFYRELDVLWEEMDILMTTQPNDKEEAQANNAKISKIENRINQIYNEHYAEMQVYRPQYYQHHETPYEQVGDVAVVASNNYFFYYLPGDEVSPDIIREKGLLTNSKVILKKEFTVTGIIQTYTDKWDLGGHKAVNAFITEEGGKTFTDAFYNNNIGDFSDYQMDYNVFLYSDSLNEGLYSTLKDNYKNKEAEIFTGEEDLVQGFDFWISMYGRSDEEIEKEIKDVNQWSITRHQDDIKEVTLEESTESKVEVSTDNFRRNKFSYPINAGTTEYILTLTIIGVIFIATALAIFQIFLTQMKRRGRKIVLLKSIGTTNLQMVEMLFYEGMYLLRTGLLIGLPTGFGLAYLVVKFMNAYGGSNISFHVIPSILVLGIIAGCLALFVGMAVPMIYAVRIPPVGTMSKPPKHKKLKHKDDIRKIHFQSFNYINWKYFMVNKGKTFISFGISLMTITILLTSVLLCYLSFNNYRTTVLAKKRPDYAMETFIGDAQRQLRLADEEIRALDGVKSTEIYKVGINTFLWYEGIEANKMLNNFEKLLPGKLLEEHFSRYNAALKDEPEWIKNALFTKIYGIAPEGELFHKYNSQLTDGSIDIESFKKGEEVILLIPLYHSREDDLSPIDEVRTTDATNKDNRMSWLFSQTDSQDINYNSRFKGYYDKIDYLKPGDNITLSVDKEEIVGDSYVSGFRTEEFIVAGIIYYFQEEQIWPFSNSNAPYVVVGSMNFMETMYPNSATGLRNQSLSTMKSMVDVLYPTKFGRTLWYINSDSSTRDVVLESKLLSYANNNGYTLYNYKESNTDLYQEGFNNSMIIGLLGFTSASIALIILYNILVSKLEQDKNRIGILQAIGVTRSKFSNHYLLSGIIHGTLSIVMANLLLMVVMLITTGNKLSGLDITFFDFIRDILNYGLFKYPWMIHLTLCIIFFLLTILVHYLPARRITRQYPVENIRSLGR